LRKTFIEQGGVKLDLYKSGFIALGPASIAVM
jgi:hypothetical protein